MTATLDLERVTIRYDGIDAVRGVTESVAAGEWVGIIGPNGAGKSSLLRAVAHLITYTGAIHIDGADAAHMSRRNRAKLIAYVPQQPELPAGMSALEYTLLGRTPHIPYFGVESPEDRRHCLDVLDQLELGDRADRNLATLSGGELQRVVLARALSQDAPVLLLDEPTSALDLGRRVDALELVDALRRAHGLTVVSAMHDLTLAAQFADRLVLLSEGAVIASGPPAEVLSEDVLSACFGVRVRVIADDGGLLVVPQRSDVRTR
ncbi:MAG TPA: ABC transporter ATP-binding protein [Jatrophihabitantaceae bacterium]|nr:ABC transporter ATP-binding protein [Jatrophihabitantaceae bacterium]